MVKLCPVCQKRGDNKKIIAVQINYEQAVWMCESQTCSWPFGYEEFTFIPRIINLENIIENTDIQKYRDSSQTPLSDLGLYTPPVTPSGERFGKEYKHDFTGETYTSAAHNIKQSPYQLNISTTSDQIEIKTEKDVVTSDPSATVQSIFDIDSAVIDSKLNQLPVKNSNDSFITNNKTKNDSRINGKNGNQVRNRPLIRSIEVTNVNVLDTKSENDSKVDRGKYNVKIEKKLKVMKKNSIIDKNMFKKTDDYITKAKENSQQSSLSEKVGINVQNSSQTKLVGDEGMLFNRHNDVLSDKHIITTDVVIKNESEEPGEKLHSSDHDYFSKNLLNDMDECDIEIEDTKPVDNISQLMKPMKVEAPTASDDSIPPQIFDGILYNYDCMNSSQDLDDDWIKSFLV